MHLLSDGTYHGPTMVRGPTIGWMVHGPWYTTSKAPVDLNARSWLVCASLVWRMVDIRTLVWRMIDIYIITSRVSTKMVMWVGPVAVC